MALRVLQANPAIGGFGGESSGQLDYYTNTHNNDADNIASKDRQSSSEGGQTNVKQSHRQPTSSVGGESCDAFVQIVKELVDNAVDACARDENNVGTDNNNVDEQQTQKKNAVAAVASSKRVRVEIKPTQISTGDDDDDDNTKAMMECVRVKVSDNGCGMEDIDACVSAFRSTKNSVDDDGADKVNFREGGGSKSNKKNKNNRSSKKKNTGGSGAKNKQATASYTSGRYGVGLTLCLLHAQRLVPNSVTLIITSTKTSDYWTIRRYRADTEKDEIVCLKEERLPKIDKDECGTIVEILVPGGQGAISAWPRLAEYFARFQLSIDLPCSIEVKAEALQPLPLYIRPPRELERRMCRKMMNGKENDAENGSVFNEEEDDDDDDWGDGFDEGAEETENKGTQSVSKASLERARVDEDKKRKISLMQKAACLYKGRRVDLRNVDVAYSMQRIRNNNEVGKSTSQTKTCPILEMSMIVFGQEITDNDDDSLEDTCCDKTAKLHIVRMVNGIPVLDSSEALACGVITKISNNPTIWNSFGLDIRQRDQQTAGCPTFDINDSGQVAPFLRTSTHSLYNSQSQGDVFSASDQDDNDDFDLEDMHSSARRKRKNEQQARCILPAAERLGDVMIVVQIRAKPSALPLPTLSKGRLPMNNKSIDNAIENAVTDCLRNLQTQNPRLLLTAQQLKKVERDVKYAPLVAGAIASVLSRSRKEGLYQNTVNVSSCWDDEVERLGLSIGRMSVSHRNEQGDSTLSADNEREKSQSLGRMIERRLRFVVSDEFRAHQKAEEMEHRRQRREELAAERKRAKTESKVTESDGLNSDVFGSDEDSTCSITSARNNMTFKDESEGGFVGDGFQSDDSSNNDVGDVETVREKNGDKVQEDDDSWSSEFGECVDISFFR